jgi:formate hydrogenlyase transcriptional activator
LIDGAKEKCILPSTASQPKTSHWLLKNGLKVLELLFRAIICRPSTSVLITDDDRRYRDASPGAAKLLGLPLEKIIDRSLDDFVVPEEKPSIPKLWHAFLNAGEQAGSLQILGPDGTPQKVEYSAKKNVLPVRHLLVLHDNTYDSELKFVSPSALDCAFFLADEDGKIVAWYGGAERIYGYRADEAIGQNLSFLYPGEDKPGPPQKELKRATGDGHLANEGWHLKKDGARFWANAITTAIKDERGELQGFAGVVRDFSDRHERDEKLRRRRARARPIPAASAIPGVVYGEFDRITDANDTFLEFVGYSREDLIAGRPALSDLTPEEYSPLDDFAHEEALLFRACTPFEKVLIRKDGTRVPVLITTAVVKIVPFHWITFITDLRERDRQESIEVQAAEVNQHFAEIVGSSAAMTRMMGQVEVVAPTDATVLILGETGTGKDLIARAIHLLSPRRKLPCISLNCAAIPTGLLESELFGYERGAFTGALSQKIGRFEMAHRGTLFLDEVGDIPLDLQPKLLRALQEKSFERLGGTHTISIDVRLVAATNRNLTQMMGDKLFRSDLYYRLRVFPIISPPLRDHAEDIPALARHFTKKYAEKMDRKIEKIPAETMKALASWSWPGNVRELENFIERSVILSPGSSLCAPLSELRADAPEAGDSATLESVERDHILRVFRETGGLISAAAKRLGVPRTTLNAMMKKLGISRDDL